ncbi:MAG: hypothetical protein HFF29_06820 [Oscillospiraceae bacterium]|nr:hypothetical protein [Oscillospiraceae bacterium]
MAQKGGNQASADAACVGPPEAIMTPREASFAPSEAVSVENAAGRIAAESRVACPPGIPVVAAGEKIGENEKKLLKNSGIFSIFVIK